MRSHPEPGQARPVTINDIARVTNVAASTVSRALNNPGRVNPATRERIQAAAQQLNYVPNSQARALTSGRTETVALLVSDVTNPFYFGIIRGTQRALNAAGYAQMLIDIAENAGGLEVEVLHKMRRSMDGAIVAGSRLTDKALSALAEEMPLVAINRNLRDNPGVIIDTPGAVQHAVEHLASLGHRRIAYVSGPSNSWPNGARWRAMGIAGRRLVLHVSMVGPFSPVQESGTAAADAVLNTGATACVAYNDLLAIGMLNRLRERGVRVPDELSVVGCDDIFGADFCNPPLTTLTAPIERAGGVAASMLLARLKATTTSALHTIVLPTHLTVRDSTGPVPRPTRDIA
ncbi:LacI family DNA-binding transcriptional regulator [Catenulispora rubra]|uniref:LacI family DNA-binding transcriptional regulator n=1 Tax=Catenulispora rubra TaxID=280293 RepID=UPI0018921D47|nr:LacI family DNA-binding transcriptional regulator [Catenulispora rubra]